jgi:alpha-2-macroglobulin
MNDRRRFVASALLALLCSVAAFAILRGATPQESTGDLEVRMVSPRGDVKALHSIDVVFDEGMVPLGIRGKAKGTAPLVIEPRIDGAFSWIGSNALTFVPRGTIAPGTRLTCRIPKGTRSLADKTTGTDYVWEIIVGRPGLLESVPRQGSLHAPDEPIYLAFTTVPAGTAAGRIQLLGDSGPIPMTAIVPDSQAVRQLTRQGQSSLPSENVLALRPEQTLTPGRSYRIILPEDLRFAGTDVGLAKADTIPFTATGDPSIESLAVVDDGFDLDFAGPVDPDSLRKYLSVTPDIGKVDIRPWSGTSLRVSSNGIRAGMRYDVRIRAGMPSLFGMRLAADQVLTAEIPHQSPRLRIVPSDGFVPAVHGLAIRIEGRNVGSVEIRGGWVRGDSLPARLTGQGRDLSMVPLTRLGYWTQPRETPDSSRALQIPLEKLGARPPGAQAIQVRVYARALYPEEDGRLADLRDDGLIQITDLGISAITGTNRGLVWVTRLSTAESVVGAKVRLHVPGIAKPLWTGVTGDDGLLWMPSLKGLNIPAGRNPVVSVESGKDAVWLKLSYFRGGWGREGSPEDDGAITAADTTAVFAFTDRPLYRPGEQVHWIALARSITRGGLGEAGLPALSYRLFAPDGRTVDRGRVVLDVPGQTKGDYAIPPGAPLGSYNLTLFPTEDASGRSCGNTYFRVEEYRLPRFEARLESPSRPAISGSRTEVTGRFAYLNGGPLAGAPVKWTITRTPDWETPREYQGFIFYDPRARDTGEEATYGMTRVAAGEARLDAEGRLRLPIQPDLSGLGQDQSYYVEVGARDLADRSAYDVATFTARRAAIRVGARLALDMTTDRPALDASIACLDSTDQPISGTALRWQIEKRIWKTVRVRRIGGVFGYENVPMDSVAASGVITSTSGVSRFRWVPPNAGSYSMLVEATDTSGRATRGRDEVWVPGPESAAWYRDDQNWLELKTDKDNYSPSDTARILLPAPAIRTEGLVLTMDDGIQSAKRVRGLFGTPQIEIPLSSALPWGMFVQAVLIGPPSVPQGDTEIRKLPYFAWGRTFLNIRPDDWRLNVQVATDRPSYRPGDEVTVLISAADVHGNPVSGQATLAVVDDAIFQLTGDVQPDPVSSLYRWRGMGTEYDDVRSSLQMPVRGEKGAMSPGGDGGEEGGGLRKRFVATAHWEAFVPIGPDGRATVRFRLADDLTRYRFRVVASSGVDRFGYGETKADVRKPMQLEWASPRFTRDGDNIEVAAVVRGDFPRETEVRIVASADGARLEGKSERKIKVPAGGSARTTFRLTNPGENGVRLRLRAESVAKSSDGGARSNDGSSQGSGGMSDAVEVSIPYDRPLLWDREFLFTRVDPLLRTTVETAGRPLPDQGGLTAIVGPSLLSGMDDALAYAIDYPYGCLEQLTGSVLAIATEQRLADHLGTPLDPAMRAERAAKLDAAVSAISRCASDWEITSWPSPDSPSATDYTVGYALYGLTEAKNAKLDVPSSLVDRLGDSAAERFHNLISRTEDRDPGRLRQLAADGPWLAWTLSVADLTRSADSLRVRPDDVEALLAIRTSAPLESKILLALTMANLRHREDARTLTRNAEGLQSLVIKQIHDHEMQRTGRSVWLSSTDRSWGDGIGGDVRATALFLRLLAQSDPSNQDIPGIVTWILEQRRPTSGAWSNNHITALTLDLLTTTVSTLEGPASEVTGTVAVGSDFSDFRFGAKRGTAWRKFVPMADIIRQVDRTGSTALRVETRGQRTVYFTASLDQARPALDAPAREEGMIVDRSYVDAAGNPLGDRIPLGEPLFVHLAVVVSRDAHTLLVEDPLPGGIEALNLTFRNSPSLSMGERPDSDDPSALSIVYRELRDRSVRLFAADVPAGIYHIYYPAIATTAGTYKVPGARAEMLYSPEIYATSPPAALRIESVKR